MFTFSFHYFLFYNKPSFYFILYIKFFRFCYIKALYMVFFDNFSVFFLVF